MALVYFDASALVKLVVDEAGTDLAVELWDGCDAALSSRLTVPEVRSALAAARRRKDLTSRHLTEAEEAWQLFWSATRPVELTRDVALRAGDLAKQHALRGADAVHLASALAIGDPGLVLAVWDRQLHRAAMAEHLAVAPAVLS